MEGVDPPDVLELSGADHGAASHEAWPTVLERANHDPAAHRVRSNSRLAVRRLGARHRALPGRADRRIRIDPEQTSESRKGGLLRHLLLSVEKLCLVEPAPSWHPTSERASPRSRMPLSEGRPQLRQRGTRARVRPLHHPPASRVQNGEQDGEKQSEGEELQYQLQPLGIRRRSRPLACRVENHLARSSHAENRHQPKEEKRKDSHVRSNPGFIRRRRCLTMRVLLRGPRAAHVDATSPNAMARTTTSARTASAATHVRRPAGVSSCSPDDALRTLPRRGSIVARGVLPDG